MAVEWVDLSLPQSVITNKSREEALFAQKCALECFVSVNSREAIAGMLCCCMEIMSAHRRGGGGAALEN